MSSISRIGPATPSPDVNKLEQAIERYANLLSHPDSSSSDGLKLIADQTIELSQLAQSVMHVTSPAFRATAGDLEKMLEVPLSINNPSKNVSILTASQHYLDNPATAELKPLIDELCKNNFALERMREELHLLSSSIKSPNAPGR